MNVPRMPRSIGQVLGWIGAVIGGLVFVFAWSMSSPIGSSPDEPAHLSYSWGVATGQTGPGVEVWRFNSLNQTITDINVPVELFDYEDINCYAFKAGDPPGLDCPRSSYAIGESKVTQSYMTGYPPLYYAAIGMVMRGLLKVGASGEAILLAARVFSGLLSLAIVASAVLVARRRFSSGAVSVATLVFMTPVTVYMFTSVNPNGFEISAAFAAAIGIVSVREEVRKGVKVGIGLQIYLILAMGALAWSRPLSFAWAGLLCLLLIPRVAKGVALPIQRLRWWCVTALVLAVTAAIAWFGYAWTMRAPGDESVADWNSLSAPLRILEIVLKFGDLLYQGFGLLGWGDTPLPRLGMIVWLVIAAVALTSMAVGSRRSSTRVRWAGLFLALCGVVIVGQSFIAAFGWQGRYMLPCLAAFAGLCTPSLNGRLLSAVRRRSLVVTLSTLTFLLLMVGLLWNLWRYIYGFLDYFARFESVPVPGADIGWDPMVGQQWIIAGAVVGSLALIVALILPVLRVGTGVLSTATAPDRIQISADAAEV